MRRFPDHRIVLVSTFVLLKATVALTQAPGLAPGEKIRIVDLKPRVLELIYKVTDLSGKPVDIGGRVEDMEIRETPTEVTIELNADVLFDFDKADVLPKAQETLQKAADFIRERAKGAVRIEGHTDAKGDDNYNMRLSLRRADSVRNWLAGKAGLSSMQFSTRGLGETAPVAPNTKPDGSDDPEGRQKNRRVSIVIQKGG
jgi:outer membrane protein OmpA-like peptidoglycan-associated protein